MGLRSWQWDSLQRAVTLFILHELVQGYTREFDHRDLIASHAFISLLITGQATLAQSLRTLLVPISHICTYLLYWTSYSTKLLASYFARASFVRLFFTLPGLPTIACLLLRDSRPFPRYCVDGACRLNNEREEGRGNVNISNWQARLSSRHGRIVTAPIAGNLLQLQFSLGGVNATPYSTIAYQWYYSVFWYSHMYVLRSYFGEITSKFRNMKVT